MDSPRSFGQQCADEIIRAKQSATASGGQLMKSGVAAIIDRLDAARAECGTVKKSVPRTETKLKFEAFCNACGIPIAGMTKPMQKTVAVALCEIERVMPVLTVREIILRVNQYRRVHPTWPLTPTAVAKYWGSLATAETQLSALDEPAAWRERAVEVFAPEVEAASARYIAAQPWTDISRGNQSRIIRVMGEIGGESKIVQFAG